MADSMRDALVAQEIYSMLAKRFEEARISEVMQPTDAQIVNPAVEPERRIRPRRTLNVAIAALLGLFCGIGQCNDCVVVVNGQPGVRSCVTPLQAGMKVETQTGLGKVGITWE